MQNAWEQYYADNNANYPGTTTAAACSASLLPTPALYLPGGFPVDPKTSTTYPAIATGWSSCSSTTYCFCAGLEEKPTVRLIVQGVLHLLRILDWIV